MRENGFRAAGYVRRSADDPRSVSLEVQREAIESAAREAGYDYDPRRDLYDEGMGTSGQTMMAERDAGSRLLADLPEYDAVIVYGQDRLARGDLQWALTAQSFRAAGVEVIGVQDDIDLGRASGRFKSSIMAALGGYHAEVTAEKMRDSHRQRAEQGYYRGGPVPYGWRLEPTEDGAHKRLVLDDEEAAVIREAVDRYLRGESANAVAQDFSGAASVVPRVAAGGALPHASVPPSAYAGVGDVPRAQAQ